LALMTMKVVASCEKLRVGASRPLNLRLPNYTLLIVAYVNASN